MQSPVRIEFQGMNRLDAVHYKILRYVEELYEINIRLALPDHKEVNVGRTPRADERHGDIDFALHDAFKRARRQLQDRSRRLQGQVKTHEVQPTGEVTHLEQEFGVLKRRMGGTSISIVIVCSMGILRN